MAGLEDIDGRAIAEDGASRAIGSAIGLNDLGPGGLVGILGNIAGSRLGQFMAKSGLSPLQLQGIDVGSLHTESTVGDRIARGVVRQIPILGPMAIDGGTITEHHQTFTKEMSDQNVPGFMSRDVELSDGSTMTIHADASGVASQRLDRNGEPQFKRDGSPRMGTPKTFTEGSTNDLSDRDQSTLRDARRQLGREAHQEVYDDAQRRGGANSYNNMLQDKIDDYRDQEVSALENEGDFTQTASVAVNGDQTLAADAGLANAPTPPQTAPAPTTPTPQPVIT